MLHLKQKMSYHQVVTAGKLDGSMGEALMMYRHFLLLMLESIQGAFCHPFNTSSALAYARTMPSHFSFSAANIDWMHGSSRRMSRLLSRLSSRYTLYCSLTISDTTALDK
jgi:hypothetical protein